MKRLVRVRLHYVTFNHLFFFQARTRGLRYEGAREAQVCLHVGRITGRRERGTRIRHLIHSLRLHFSPLLVEIL